MYRFSVWNFSDKEIDQICQLTRAWANGSTRPVDMRRYTDQVLHYAKSRNLIMRGDKFPTWSETYKKFFAPNPHRFFLSYGNDFDPRYSLPPECLWRILKPAIDKATGRSLATYKEWLDLNIAPETHKYHKHDRDLNAMIEIFCLLDQWHYIIFQYAGSVWQVTPTPELAIRSEL